MRLMLFITGHTGAGKTTIVRKLASRGWETIIVGDLFRKSGMEAKPGEIFPECFEDLLHNTILSRIKAPRRTMGCEFVVIDGVPRTGEQVDLVRAAQDAGWATTCLFVTATPAMRDNRVRSRAATTERDLKLDRSKMVGEAPILKDMLAEYFDVFSTNMPSFDTTMWQVNVPENGDSGLLGLEAMLTAAMNIFRSRRSIIGNTEIGPMTMLRRMRQELDEFESVAVGDKLKRQGETIDILWFAMMLCMSEGLKTAEDIYKLFMQKSDINQYRESTGNKPDVDVVTGGD